MKENIKIGIIGLGQRGNGMLENPIIPMLKNGVDIEITAVCDLLPDRVAAAEKLEKAGFPRPMEFTDYKELLKIKELDAVYIVVSWEAHAEVAVAAMYAGKAVRKYDITGCATIFTATAKTTPHTK